jgi:hypothetical protein
MTLSSIHDHFREILSEWKRQLQSWSIDGSISSAAQEVFLLDAIPDRLAKLIDQWASSDFDQLPPIKILPATQIPGAKAAYAISTNTIYVNESWIGSVSVSQVLTALTEELGHFFDAILNIHDSPGDEGEIFSRILGGLDPQSNALDIVRQQDDQTLLLVNGEWIPAEAAAGWPQIAGGVGSENSLDVVAASDGTSFIVGNFRDTATFGQFTLAGQDSSNSFFSKLNQDGSFAWASMAQTEPFFLSSGYTLDTLGDGSLIVSGNFSGLTIFDNLSIAPLVQGSYDFFVARLNSNGSFDWVTQVPVGGNAVAAPRGITALGDGSSIITGIFNGTAVFGDTSLVSISMEDIFVAKLAADGSIIWATQAGGQGNDAGRAISSFADGSSIITGDFGGGLYGTPAPASFGTTTLNSNGSPGSYVAKVDPNGSFVWATQAVGSVSFSNGVSSLPDGSSLISGDFSGTVTFGDITLSANSLDQRSVFTAKLTADGAFAWVSQPDSIAGSVATSVNKSISAIADGSSFVTGYFSGEVVFGPDVLSTPNSFDVYVAKVNPDGTYSWAAQAGGPGNENIRSITALDDGSSIVTGEFQGSLYGTTPGTISFGEATLASSSFSDIFIAKLNPDGTWVNTVAPLLSEISVSVAPSSVAEDGTTNLVYTFSRTGPTTDALTVNFTVTGTATEGTDYATVGTTAVFAGPRPREWCNSLGTSTPA